MAVFSNRANKYLTIVVLANRVAAIPAGIATEKVPKRGDFRVAGQQQNGKAAKLDVSRQSLVVAFQNYGGLAWPGLGHSM